MYLEHVNMTVAQLDRSIDFYTRLFGFRVRWRSAADDPDPAVHLGDDRFYLAMFEAPGPGTASKDYDIVGLNHFGLVVDDLEAFRAKLAEMGVSPHLERDYEPGRRLYFYDPDGIEVELVEY